MKSNTGGFPLSGCCCWGRRSWSYLWLSLEEDCLGGMEETMKEWEGR